MERPYRRRARWAVPLLLIAATLFTAFAGQAYGRAPASPTRFACTGGASFTVTYVRDGAWVTTSAGRWLLRRVPSGIGKRYTSAEATFILDQERAALVGLPGGPFLRCIAAAPSLAPRRLS